MSITSITHPTVITGIAGEGGGEGGGGGGNLVYPVEFESRVQGWSTSSTGLFFVEVGGVLQGFGISGTAGVLSNNRLVGVE